MNGPLSLRFAPPPDSWRSAAKRSGRVLTYLRGVKRARQSGIAVDRACWQGEPVCAVVAKTRARPKDACELIEVTYEVLPAVTDAETALDAGTPVIHSDLGDNLC